MEWAVSQLPAWVKRITISGRNDRIFEDKILQDFLKYLPAHISFCSLDTSLFEMIDIANIPEVMHDISKTLKKFHIKDEAMYSDFPFSKLKRIIASFPASINGIDLTILRRAPSYQPAQGEPTFEEVVAAIPASVRTLNFLKLTYAFNFENDLPLFMASIPATINTLNISNYSKEHSNIEIATIIKHIPTHINSVRLKNNYSGDKTAKSIENSVINLKEKNVNFMDLSDNQLVNFTYRQLQRFIKKLPTTVTTLKLSGNGLVSMEDQQLKAFLPNAPTVIKLDLSNDNIGQQDISTICKFISSLPSSLKTIDLSRNNLFTNKTREQRDDILETITKTCNKKGFTIDISYNGESEIQRALTSLAQVFHYVDSYVKSSSSLRRDFPEEIIHHVLSYLAPHGMPDIDIRKTLQSPTLQKANNRPSFSRIDQSLKTNEQYTINTVMQSPSDEYNGASIAFLLLQTPVGITHLTNTSNNLLSSIDEKTVNLVIETGRYQGKSVAYTLLEKENLNSLSTTNDNRLLKFIKNETFNRVIQQFFLDSKLQDIKHILQSTCPIIQNLILDGINEITMNLISRGLSFASLLLSQTNEHYLCGNNCRLLRLINETTLNMRSNGGIFDGRSLAYMLAAKHNYLLFFQDDNYRLLKLINPSTFNYIRPHQGTSLALVLTCRPERSEFLMNNHIALLKSIQPAALNRISSKGFSVALGLASSQEGLEFIVDFLYEKLDENSLNSKITKGPNKENCIATAIIQLDQKKKMAQKKKRDLASSSNHSGAFFHPSGSDGQDARPSKAPRVEEIDQPSRWV